MKNPQINDYCNVFYDGRSCIAKVICINENTFDVVTSFGHAMYNIPFEKFRYNSTETEIGKFDTIKKIVAQLETCKYECEGGSLENNVAFLALKRMIK